jgi:putative radical SAM enzyme (TIGR03279 family)
MEIKEVEKGSIAHALGILPGDTLCALNGHVISDEIDLAFWEADERFILEIGRNSSTKRITGRKLAEERLGIHLGDFVFKRCNNRCIFCFYDQMPPGMRESLYQKDDDYRLSFLYGNYITLTNMSDDEFARIEEQRLSPLFISVHATDADVRRRLLGGTGGSVAIEPLLRRLADAAIQMHTQIVICPGINDGAVLERTVRDLASLYPHVRSIAIIPVGLTKHRHGLSPLQELDRKQALELIRKVLVWQEDFRVRFGMGFVYPSDELLIRGEFGIPMREFYDGFPQLENGIGNSRLFLDGIEVLDTNSVKRLSGAVVMVTALLPRPWLELLRKRLERETMLSCEVLEVSNSLLGESVTVSGLLAGQDVLHAIAAYEKHGDLFLIPSNCLNVDHAFIDDVTLDDIGTRTGKRLVAAPPDPAALPGLLLQELSR